MDRDTKQQRDLFIANFMKLFPDRQRRQNLAINEVGIVAVPISIHDEVFNQEMVRTIHQANCHIIVPENAGIEGFRLVSIAGSVRKDVDALIGGVIAKMFSIREYHIECSTFLNNRIQALKDTLRQLEIAVEYHAEWNAETQNA